MVESPANLTQAEVIAAAGNQVHAFKACKQVLAIHAEASAAPASVGAPPCGAAT
jgi:hypothetical protein